MNKMTTDERNFRSSYYEKVGCRGVEEKKSLEILMKEKPWDKTKLKQFCLRFTLPAAYRTLVWKVLLGVLPVYSDSHQFVMEQRSDQYEDLLHALRAMDSVQEDAPRSRLLLAMWQLESGRRTLPQASDPAFPMERSFLSIADALLRLYEDEVDVYWLAKGFCGLACSAGALAQRDNLADLAATVLQMEDQILYNHLVETESLQALPLVDWFNCCFAGVLDDASLVKIWDKLCGGAHKILAFVAVMVLRTARQALLRTSGPRQALGCLAQMPEQCEELIALKALELWHHYGAQPKPDPLVKK